MFALRTISKLSRSSISVCGKRPYASHGKNLPPILVDKSGLDLINDPLLNKSNGYSEAERDRFSLRGLIPPNVSTIEEQAKRVKMRLDLEDDPIRKFLMFSNLQDRNEHLFYKVLMSNIEELAPIVYTPTVGQVCQRFGFLYRRPRGMHISPQDRGKLASIMYNHPENEIDVIVMTDGSRILGLGDLGAHGAPIPIGKLSLYVAAAGIHPSRVLPIMLDMGTNNQALLDDPLYMGWRSTRISGTDYYDFVDELLWAIYNRWPNVLVQFEDFSNENAAPLLEKYRRKYLCFNDDIQGTGAVALAGVMTALRAQGKPISALRQQRIVCLGAGSAGLGVVQAIMHGMRAQDLSEAESARNFWLVDKDGLLTDKRKPLGEAQSKFARTDMEEGTPLLEVIKKVKPTILLGLSGVGKTFTEEIVKEMAAINKRPIIFPLSNPTDRAECSFEDAVNWTNGQVIFASGSPFEPVEYNGKTYYPSQGNNMFIYPGIGLGVTACKARNVTWSMFMKAAETLCNNVPNSQLEKGLIYPNINDIRRVSLEIAIEVVKLAVDLGLNRKQVPHEISGYIKSRMYEPQYQPYVGWNLQDSFRTVSAEKNTPWKK